MPSVLDEDVLGTAAAARYLSQRCVDPADQKFGPTLIWRWHRQGRTAADGERVFLECARLGRKLVTSRQALARFAERLTQRPHPVAVQSGEAPAGSGATDARHDLEAQGFFA